MTAKKQISIYTVPLENSLGWGKGEERMLKNPGTGVFLKKGETMNKTLLCVLAAVIILLFGCAESELPPEPGAPGDTSVPIGGATEYSDAYGSPFDPQTGEQFFFLDPMLLTVTPGLEKETINVNVEYPSALIYYRGYVYSKQGWKEFFFDEPRYKDSSWIRDSANVDVGLQISDFYEGENYVVIYACKLVNGEWKCGWDGADKNYRWSLNSFILRFDELPPEPIEPGSLVNRRMWTWPNQAIVKPGAVWMGLGVSSTWNELSELDDTTQVYIVKKGVENYEIPVTLRSYDTEPSCSTGNPSWFECWRYYYPEEDVQVNDLGMYTIDIRESSPAVEVFDGEFMVESVDVWADNLIEQDIGSYNYPGYSWGDYYGPRDNLMTVYGTWYGLEGLERYVGVRIENNPMASISEDPVQIVIVNGYTLEKRSWISEWGYCNEETCWYREVMNVEYSWMSGDRRVQISIFDVEGYDADADPVLLAYIAKHVPDSPPSAGDTCTETPEDFFVKETVTINKRNGEEWTRDDECMLDGRVQEVLCMDSGDYAGSKNYGASYLLCPFGCADGACLWDTSCTSDTDCQLVNKDLGVLCCYEGQCDTINYYDAKWIAVNKETYSDAPAAFCPSAEACGPAPGCPSSMIDTDARAACIQEVCQKVSGVAASSE